MQDWKVYRGDGNVDADRWQSIPAPPPWRDFTSLARQRAVTFRPPPQIIEVVNAALYLRRPLLVTGDPGVGKSSLAYSIAWELNRGNVLTWNINSRSTLGDGLYLYDALARLRQVSLDRARHERSRPGAEARDEHDGARGPADLDDGTLGLEDIGRYIQLGALGTAFVATEGPRVVLIDEIDKSDIDLPNDLLHVFENGEFEIPELVRIADRMETVTVTTSDGEPVEIRGGHVRCRHFPIIVVTSNGERDLPPAFLRRCLRADIPRPDPEQLRSIVEAHLGGDDAGKLDEMLALFEQRREAGAMLATDQLLNAFYLVTRGSTMSSDERAVLDRVLLRDLSR